MNIKRETKIKQALLNNFGQTFSEALGIWLAGADSREIFKWFLASILFGARISETIVINTYNQFEQVDVTTPDNILQSGWDGLVEILDEGGYVRYDFKTATKLLNVAKSLNMDYKGDLNILHEKSSDVDDLQARIQGLGKGIGTVTCNIFLREMRPYWKKARPGLSSLARMAAGNLGLTPGLKPASRDFSRLEAALVRLGKDFCHKSRCPICKLNKFCKVGGKDVGRI